MPASGRSRTFKRAAGLPSANVRFRPKADIGHAGELPGLMTHSIVIGRQRGRLSRSRAKLNSSRE